MTTSTLKMTLGATNSEQYKDYLEDKQKRKITIVKEMQQQNLGIQESNIEDAGTNKKIVIILSKENENMRSGNKNINYDAIKKRDMYLRINKILGGD